MVGLLKICLGFQGELKVDGEAVGEKVSRNGSQTLAVQLDHIYDDEWKNKSTALVYYYVLNPGPTEFL